MCFCLICFNLGNVSSCIDKYLGISVNRIEVEVEVKAPPLPQEKVSRHITGFPFTPPCRLLFTCNQRLKVTGDVRIHLQYEMQLVFPSSDLHIVTLCYTLKVRVKEDCASMWYTFSLPPRLVINIYITNFVLFNSLR